MLDNTFQCDRENCQCAARKFHRAGSSGPDRSVFSRRRTRRWKALLLIILACISLGGTASAIDRTPVRERQFKAAFIYNFTKFIEWPSQSFADANSPFVIGLYCRPSFSAELEKVIKEQAVNGHPLSIRILTDPSQAASTQMVYVCAEKEPDFHDMLRSIGARPVLTVGETETFDRHGGMIALVLEGDRIRFDINVGTAERSQLKISAQLQKLARVVRRAP